MWWREGRAWGKVLEEGGLEVFGEDTVVGFELECLDGEVNHGSWGRGCDGERTSTLGVFSVWMKRVRRDERTYLCDGDFSEPGRLVGATRDDTGRAELEAKALLLGNDAMEVRVIGLAVETRRSKSCLVATLRVMLAVMSVAR